MDSSLTKSKMKYIYICIILKFGMFKMPARADRCNAYSISLRDKLYSIFRISLENPSQVLQSFSL
jgi:hypothetical protein